MPLTNLEQNFYTFDVVIKSGVVNAPFVVALFSCVRMEYYYPHDLQFDIG